MFLDFVHRKEFQVQEDTAFRKLDLFPSSGEGEDTCYLHECTPKSVFSSEDRSNVMSIPYAHAVA
jgi:hypothetical protein